MKKLHLFILKSYFGPLVMTFFIAMFILVLQFLWRYVDELVGKGLEWYVLGELLFFASLQVVPMALPLAILLASLMTFGNLGENYELTALKSAGISLPKIMMPLVILTVLISGMAYGFSNNILPVANLKLVSILHGIRETRPELDIREKVFYRGIDAFSIKINEKDTETNLLHDIMIYDHRDVSANNSNVTLADSGRLEVSEDKGHLKLTLFGGTRYDERVLPEPGRRQPRSDSRMFRIDEFSKQVAIIQLQGFDFSRTDENLFRQGDRMKNIQQLTHDIDSMRQERHTMVSALSQRSNHFYLTRVNTMPDHRVAVIDTATFINADSIFNSLSATQKETVILNATRHARDNKFTIDDKVHFVAREDLKIRRHLMEFHRKFTLPFACLIFFFIGAPLGAIIRKGGLGMPVVISVFFFIIYYIIDTMGAKFAREGVWPVHQGMWLSSFILLPIGIFLTFKSATDSKLLNADAYFIFIKKLRDNILKPISRRKISRS